MGGTKRTLAVLLAICMVVALTPMAAAADDPVEPEAQNEEEPVVQTEEESAAQAEQGAPEEPVVTEEPAVETLEGMVDSTEPAQFPSWYADSGSHVIDTAAELLEFAALVNDGTDNFEGETVTLGDNIDLKNVVWTPIGNGTYPFKGTFDGNNKTIYNFELSKDLSGYYNGFFGNALGGAIQNVTFDKPRIEDTNDSSVANVAVAAGYSVNTDFTNVNVVGGTMTSGGCASITGVLGGDGVMEGCYSNATINATPKGTRLIIGGLVHQVAMQGITTGGTDEKGLGTQDETWITLFKDCTFEGVINVNAINFNQSSTGWLWVGQLFGGTSHNGYWTVVIEDCVAGGTVNITNLTATEPYIDNKKLYFSAYVNGAGTLSVANHTANLNGVNNAVFVPYGRILETYGACIIKDGVSTHYASPGDTNPTVVAAKIGSKHYTTLDAAIAAVEAGDTVTLLKDLTIGALSIENKHFTLDLNGKTVSATASVNIGKSGDATKASNITIKDSVGGGEYAGDGTFAVMLYNRIGSTLTIENGTYRNGTADDTTQKRIVQNQGTLTIKDGTFTVLGTSTTAASNANNIISCVGSGNTENVTSITKIENGEFTCNAVVITGNGSAAYGGTRINISGGSFVSTSGSAIFHPQMGELNISGGTISGIDSGVGIKSGTLNIIGGTIACTGPNTAPTTGFSNGLKGSGAALQIESNSSYVGDVEICITDGILSSANGYAIYEYLASNITGTAIEKIDIQGGKFSSGTNLDNIMISSELNSDSTARPIISGGYFSSDPSAYVAAGKVVRAISQDPYKYIVENASSGRPRTPVTPPEAPATEPSAPVTPSGGDTTTVTTTVEPTTSGNVSTATVGEETINEALTAASEAAAESETVPVVEIEVAAPETATEVVAELPAAALDSVAEQGASLSVTSPVGEVTLPAEALESIAEQAGDEDLSLSIKVVEPESLTEEQQEALGDQTDAIIIDLTLTAGDTTISSLGGKVKIAVPYTPEAGEDVSKLVVWFLADDGSITPMEGVFNSATGCFEFTTDHFSAYVLVSFPFTDVDTKYWAYGNIAYAYTNGLFSGTGEETFSPRASMTRAMLWTVLGRMDGQPLEGPAVYDDARAWAVASGVSDGTRPEESITREQLVTILWRYAGSPAPASGLSGFGDQAKVSGWAAEAMAWAVENGLVQGYDNLLTPRDGATRAQVAAILQRF